MDLARFVKSLSPPAKTNAQSLNKPTVRLGQAAANLELLDQLRADWAARLAAYRQAVDDAMVQYDDAKAPDAIARRDAIRAEHFKDNELRRVISLELLQPIE